MHLNVRFSTEAEMKQTLDFLYEKSKEGIAFTGLVEAMVNEVTIVTAIHNIKSNKGSKTAGVDQMKMDRYLQMPREELIALIRDNFSNYRPRPARRVYIPKKNGKLRPLGIPTVLDRIIQECVRIIIEPICEAKFYPHSYGFRPYRAQKHAIRDIVNVINSATRSPDQPVWAVEGDMAHWNPRQKGNQDDTADVKGWIYRRKPYERHGSRHNAGRYFVAIAVKRVSE